MLLKFSKANRKLKKLANVPRLKLFLKDSFGSDKKIYSFDLPAGHTCPSADICLSKEVNGRIVDGPNTTVRCYAASEEVIFTNVRKLRNHNLDLIKESILRKNLVEKILDSLPANSGIIRIHSSGDFFVKSYFEAWLEVARLKPDVLFYGYTKNAIKWLIDLKTQNLIPPNFRFTFSIGGKQDSLIGPNDTVAKIVYSSYEARKAKLPVDHNDAHAALGRSAALIIHGIQPAGSKGAKIHYKKKISQSAVKSAK